jgi:integrase
MKFIEAVKLEKEAAAYSYENIRRYIKNEFPVVYKAFLRIDAEYTAVRVPKGYNLVKRENKRLGFVYYVRYRHEGKALPSKWCAHTNNKLEAEKFALENRERIIREYLNKKRRGGLKIIEKFYAEGSSYYQEDESRSRALSAEIRKKYHCAITKKLIPFLRENGINSYEKIDTAVMEDWQNELLKSGIKPQSVNDAVKTARRIFAYLARKRIIKENPCIGLKNIPVKKKDVKERGCLELGKIRGVFNKRWENAENKLMNMLVYTTGMRNSEIGRIKMEDIEEIKGIKFIEIKKSKTESGERLIPLHNYVYKTMKAFAADKNADESIFNLGRRVKFKSAVVELGKRIGMSAADLKKENITFYSGRHYWKTLMNAEGLGDDIEEILMGHRVAGGVAEVYNHRNKRGKGMLVKKAKKVFAILDKRVFPQKNK